MFGRFLKGECSLVEAFWQYSVLGLLVLGFLSRLFMIFLMQISNYDMDFLAIVIHNLSILNTNSLSLVWLCCYVASFLALVSYSFICVVGMWRTYKEYEKSKVLAVICMVIVWILAYTAIKHSIYGYR